MAWAATGEHADGGDYIRARAAALLHVLIAAWVFSGGFVLTEPSPYEVMFLLALAVALFAGFGLHRGTLPLLVLFALFIPFALIAAFQVRFIEVTDALIFSAVTCFLFFTSYFVANYIADEPVSRMRSVGAAYTATALIAAVVGTLGYLDLIPGADLFTRYDRAKAFFQDPNVYGPFLVLPAMLAMQRVLLANGRTALMAALVFAVLFVGIFVSFSRGAWGHLAASALLVYCLTWLLEANGRQKVRMMALAIVGTGFLVVAIAGLLSIPAVNKLFEVRAASQTHDTGETGRFGRQGYAFDLALENPLGIGPLEFRNLRVKEEPHNTYVNVLHVYGWGGGLIFIAFIGTTLWKGFSALARPSPHRILLIPLVSTFLPLCIEAAIIDVDHWRHFFLIGGLIWGVTAGHVSVAGPARRA